MTPAEERSLGVFVSYSHSDEELCQELEQHLRPLVREKSIRLRRVRDVLGGGDRRREIEQHLNAADIVLLLVSPSFLASDECMDAELERALERHETGSVRVIPIILRPCQWQVTPIGKLQALPREAKAVTTWRDKDEAWSDCAKQIRAVVAEFKPPPEAVKIKVLGVDIGATKIAVGAVDLSQSGRGLIRHGQFMTAPVQQRVDVDGLLRQVENMIEQFLEDEPSLRSEIQGIGIAAPGQVDRRSGQLVFGPNLGKSGAKDEAQPGRSREVRGVDLKKEVGRKFNLEVRVDNDARCATRCELYYGAVGQHCRNFTCIFIGTGVGSGIVVDRRIYYGKGTAGEIGHTILKLDDPDAPMCNCGQRGCLEVYVNGPGISRMARSVAEEWRKSKRPTRLHSDEGEISPEDLARLRQEKDAGAEEVIHRIAELLGLGLSNYIQVIDPDAIVLGGGIMDGFYNFMITDIKNTVDRRCRLQLDRARISQAEFVTKGAMIGAALLFHPKENWDDLE